MNTLAMRVHTVRDMLQVGPMDVNGRAALVHIVYNQRCTRSSLTLRLVIVARAVNL